MWGEVVQVVKSQQEKMLGTLVGRLSVPPRVALASLLKHGASALKPSFSPETGRWTKALVSPRVASKFRKELRINGSANLPFVGEGLEKIEEWKAVLARGNNGKEVRCARLRAPKNHKNDRTRENRAVKIEDKLKAMPKRIEEHRKAVKDRKPKPGVESLFKKLVRTKA